MQLHRKTITLNFSLALRAHVFYHLLTFTTNSNEPFPEFSTHYNMKKNQVHHHLPGFLLLLDWLEPNNLEP